MNRVDEGLPGCGKDCCICPGVEYIWIGGVIGECG